MKPVCVRVFILRILWYKFTGKDLLNSGNLYRCGRTARAVSGWCGVAPAVGGEGPGEGGRETGFVRGCSSFPDILLFSDWI